MALVIIGAGYVGLPLAISFAKYHLVICYDINKKRLEQLQKGYDFNQQHTKKEILKKKLIFTHDFDLLRNKDVYIITVPTPINSSNQPDLSMLQKASILIGRVMKKKSIIIYESTTYPGCTEEVCIPLLEKNSNLKYQKDFFVAYSPERVNPGDKINTLKNITKIVGANDIQTLGKVKKLYQHICKSIYTVDTIKIAESAKVIENIQRDINIAFVNELSVLFHKLNIPTNAVLKAASTKWNFHYYTPGLVGGHCISVDPYYLAHKAKEYNYVPKLILSGRKINESMGKYVAVEMQKILKKNRINIKTAQVAVLGFSFKENIPDIRNTKIFNIIKELQKQKIKIKVFDSVASKEEVKEKYKINIYNFKDLNKFKYDVIILAVAHKNFLKKISYYNKFYKDNKNKIFVDIKNKYSNYDLLNNGYKYFQL